MLLKVSHEFFCFFFSPGKSFSCPIGPCSFRTRRKVGIGVKFPRLLLLEINFPKWPERPTLLFNANNNSSTQSTGHTVVITISFLVLNSYNFPFTFNLRALGFSNFQRIHFIPLFAPLIFI